MTDAGVLELAQRAVALTLMICAPTLGVGLLVGLLISVFQAATQIQEMTLTFVPKIVAVFMALLFTMPWLIEKLTTYTINLFNSIPMLAR